MLRTLFLILALTPLLLHGQSEDYAYSRMEEYEPWEEFLARYASEQEGNAEDDASPMLSIAEYEALHATPININMATREDLLRLPFLDEARADSILAYRTRKGGCLYTLGELQFVSGLSHQDRLTLSHFLYAGKAPRKSIAAKRGIPPLSEGSHSLFTRFDLPLNRYAADVAHSAEESEAHPNKYFEGYRVANTTRYAYALHQTLRFGITMQKDSGEPFGTRGSHTYPFDYNSIHFMLRQRTWEVAAGDYNIHIGQGLLVGHGAHASRTALLHAMSSIQWRLTPHTSTDEARFFRGVAGGYTWRHHQNRIRLLEFVSTRRMDGTLTPEGEVSTLTSDGLHRTLSELRRRNIVANFTEGTHIAYEARQWRVGLTGVWSHYNRDINPALRPYNRYFMRGKDAAGISANYDVRFAHWQLQGEAALDKCAHLATTHTLRWQRSNWAVYGQGRVLTPEFVSPWGITIVQNSHIQNEYAALIGARWDTRHQLLLEGYAEYFRWKRPIYRTLPKAQGIETYLQATLSLPAQQELLLRYRMKTRQRTVTGYNDIMEYIGTHRLKLQWALKRPTLSLHLSVDGSLYATQTATRKHGIMLEGRAIWHPLKTLQLGGSASIFRTDDYNARLYAYMPHLPFARSMLTLHGKGGAANASALWQLRSWFHLGAQYELIHHWDRTTTGSGLTLVNSPTIHQLHFSLRLTLPPKKK